MNEYSNFSNDNLWKLYHINSVNLDDLYSKQHPEWALDEWIEYDENRIDELESEQELIEIEAAKRGLSLNWIDR